MSTRSLILLSAFLAAATLWMLRQPATQASQISNPQPAPRADEPQAVTLIFGSKDVEPSKWDGSASISAGRIDKVTGYHFTESSKILDGNAWECATHPWPPFSAGMHPNEKPQPRPTPNEPIGVTIEFHAPAEAELKIKVPRGEFSFRPMDIPETGGIFPLQATVEVYRTPLVEQITDGELEDDYPSIAADGDGLWVAWQGYQKESDQVFLRSWANGAWGNRITVTEKPADIFMTGVAAHGGKAVVVWSERDGGAWALKARWNGGRTETVTPANGNNLFHRVTSDRNGNVHVAYQSWRKGRSDIYLRSYSGGR